MYEKCHDGVELIALSMDDEQKKSQFALLRESWIQKHHEQREQLVTKHRSALTWIQHVAHPKKLLTSSLSGLMLFTPPAIHIPAFPHHTQVIHTTTLEKTAADAHPALAQVITGPIQPILTKETLIQDLSLVLPQKVQPLAPMQEYATTQLLEKYYGVTLDPVLDGIRMNTDYGLIGQEQHLALYPGDSIYTHFETDSLAKQFQKYGMAPGLGAWGYFAKSKSSLTEDDILREKYYIAVQTFLSPGYNTNVQKYYNFFKYRKVLVVNPQNGKALIVDIGDAGPAPFTGKQLGGSPEVMQYLQRVDGAQKGPVLYFFLDDSNNALPLGPIDIVH